MSTSYWQITLCVVHSHVDGVYSIQTASVADWSHWFTLIVCCPSFTSPSYQEPTPCRWCVCAYFLVCMCVSKRDGYVRVIRRLNNELMAWWVSLLPFGYTVGGIKTLIVSKAGCQIICKADACDKIMIRLLSGLHINLKCHDRPVTS